MALIKLEIDHPLEDGMSLTFKAPCDCTAVTGVKVVYPDLTENSSGNASKTFSFRDAHLNPLAGLGNLFTSGATVKIVVDTINNHAFIQNADTNQYLESRISEQTHDASDIVSGVIDVERGGTGVTSYDDLAAALGCCRIQTGSYVGTGTYGEDNPNSVTLNFVPKAVLISMNYTGTSGNSSDNHFWNGQSRYTTTYFSVNGTTFSWYDTSSEKKQRNQNNQTYYYIAFGV